MIEQKRRKIILSLKPKFANLISTRKKTYEFRKYVPKDPIKQILIYVTQPICELQYIIEIGNPIKYPGKIPENGIGNYEFNNGLKVSKYAFPINHLYKLEQGIPLSKLKSEFNFTPPQSYVYTDNYSGLMSYLGNCRIEKIY